MGAYNEASPQHGEHDCCVDKAIAGSQDANDSGQPISWLWLADADEQLSTKVMHGFSEFTIGDGFELDLMSRRGLTQPMVARGSGTVR
jgi:hypothetical protein